MSDYEELVKALRHCMTKEDGITICEPCPYYGKGIECENVLHTDAAAAIEELQAEVDALKHDIARYVQMNTDLLNEPPQFGKAGNQYTLIEPKNKRYTLRCPKCGTVVGLMEVQDGQG